MNKLVGIIIRDITSLGSVTLFVLLVLFLLSFGKVSLGINILLGLVLAVIISSIIRLIFFKNRPEKREFNNLITRIYASSFPSLHTTLTFFLALTLIGFSERIFFKIFVLVLAILVSYSRIYLKLHDWKDVFGGIVLGVMVFFIVNRVF